MSPSEPPVVAARRSNRVEFVLVVVVIVVVVVLVIGKIVGDMFVVVLVVVVAVDMAGHCFGPESGGRDPGGDGGRVQSSG